MRATWWTVLILNGAGVVSLFYGMVTAGFPDGTPGEKWAVWAMWLSMFAFFCVNLLLAYYSAPFLAARAELRNLRHEIRKAELSKRLRELEGEKTS